MNTKFTVKLAAVVAAGGLAFAIGQFSWAADDAKDADDQKQSDTSAAATSADAPAAPTFPAGVTVDDDPEEEREGVLDTLSSATAAILTKDGFDDFVERLVDQDRNRIGEDGFAERKFADLNARAEAIRTVWQKKYGDDEFELEEDDGQALAKLAVIVGKIEDPKALASAWPLPAVTDTTGAAPGEEAVPASAKETEGNKDADLDSNIEKGRGVAVTTIPASHGLPALNVSLIQELTGRWRVDVPNTLSGQQLHDSLLKHLTHVTDAQFQWPADKNEAALLIAHHVLLGAYGVDVDPAAERDGGGSQGGKAK